MKTLIFTLILSVILPGALLQAAPAHINYDKLSTDQKKTWQHLLYFSDDKNESTSMVDSTQFFISAQGRSNPQIEFDRFIQAIADNEQLHCKYPARIKWIKKQTAETYQTPEICTEYLAWRNALLGSRISLIYAAPSMESPSAMFGHTFLRFYNPKTPLLLSPTLNFNAVITENTGGVHYVLGGLFGDFFGSFDIKPMHRRMREYKGNQSRDLWEFELKLNSEQIEQIIDSAWETKDSAFRYFYTSENCAYRTLALLAVSNHKISLTTHLQKVIPVDTVRSLMNLGLIQNMKYYPALKKTLQSRIRTLSKKQIREIKQIVESHKKLTPENVSSFSSDQAIALLQIIDYKISHSPKLESHLQDTFYDAIAFLPNINSDTTEQAFHIEQPSPLSNNASTKFTVSAKHSGSAQYLNLGFRYSGYRSIENLPYLSEPANFEFFSGDVQIKDNSVKLNKFIFIQLDSSPPITPFFPKLSWHLNFSYEPNILDQKLEKSMLLNSGLGVTIGTPTINLASLVTGELVYDKDYQNKPMANFGISNSLSMNAQHLALNAFWQFQSTPSLQYNTRQQSKVELIIRLKHNTEFGLSYHRWQNSIHHFNEVNFNLGIYF